MKGRVRTQRWGTQPSLVVTESLPDPSNGVTKGCDGLMDGRENSIPWSVKPQPPILGEEERYPLTIPMGGILINSSFVFGEEAFLFSLFPSLPIIVYMEETECLLWGWCWRNSVST